MHINKTYIKTDGKQFTFTISVWNGSSLCWYYKHTRQSLSYCYYAMLTHITSHIKQRHRIKKWTYNSFKIRWFWSGHDLDIKWPTRVIQDQPKAILLPLDWLNLSENIGTKTLGIKWNISSDSFTFPHFHSFHWIWSDEMHIKWATRVIQDQPKDILLPLDWLNLSENIEKLLESNGTFLHIHLHALYTRCRIKRKLHQKRSFIYNCQIL